MEKLVYGIMKNSYNDRRGPTKWLNSVFVPSNFVLKNYFKKRDYMLKDEIKIWKKLISYQFKFPESTEKGFFNLFTFPRFSAYYPLIDELPKLK